MYMLLLQSRSAHNKLGKLGKVEGDRNSLVGAQADILFSSGGEVRHLQGQIIVRDTSSSLELLGGVNLSCSGVIYTPTYNHDTECQILREEHQAMTW